MSMKRQRQPKFTFVIAIILSACLFNTIVRADENTLSAQQWLDKMLFNLEHANYQGTFVYLHHNQVETIQIVHGFNAQGEAERLFSLNGEAREVVRNQNVVTCILPKSEQVRVDKSLPKKSFPSFSIQQLASFAPHYYFVLGKSQRIAGRSTQQVKILPMDDYRYGYDFWLDIESALPLKSRRFNHHGETIEQMLFTSFKMLSEFPDKLLQASIKGDRFRWHVDDNSETKPLMDSLWMVKSNQLPRGFRKTVHTMQPMGENQVTVEHLIFSDGLASVSVYIEPFDPEGQPLQGISKMGAVNAFGLIKHDYQITAIGEVPPMTVSLIAHAVEMEK